MTGAAPVVVTGVAGSGKSTIAREVARSLGRPFVEGDDFHPAVNIAKMRAGVPLDDADRQPWLEALGEELVRQPESVASCSALRRDYRDTLRRWAPSLVFVHLDVPADLLSRRLATRAGHFFSGNELLESQLATFEPYSLDEGAVIIAGDQPVSRIRSSVLEQLGLDRS